MRADDVTRGRAVLRSPAVPTVQPPSGFSLQRNVSRLRRICTSGFVQRTLRHPWQRAWRRQVLLDNTG